MRLPKLCGILELINAVEEYVAVKQEIIQFSQERNVYLTAYTQSVEGKFDHIVKRPAILILPGGGYQYCSAREADPVAFAYLKAGYQAFILNYSVAEHQTWPNPLRDVEMALKMIRTREDWNVYTDKVAVIGFSAGGHLAAAAATMAIDRPNAAILGYAVAGNDVKGCNLSAPDTTKYVDKYTCPCFVFSTCSDTLVAVQNSIDFMSALSKAKITFESHIYAYGPHGFSTADSSVQANQKGLSSRAGDWVQDSIGFLKDVFGDFERGGMSEPNCRRYTTHDYDPYLSADCTFGCLMTNESAKEVLKEMMSYAPKGINLEAVGGMTLRAMLSFAGYSKEKIQKLDAQLREIPNE